MMAGALFEALLSTDNNVRQTAEANYEKIPLDQKAQLLFTSLPASSGIPDEGRQLAAVMLRRLLASDFTEFYQKLPEDQKAQFKAQLLNILQTEANRNMRRKLVDLVAEVSRNLTDDDGNNLWPEFLKFLFELASAESPDAKESSLLLFGACPTIFGDQNSTYIDVIKNMLASSLTHASSYDVRFHAVKASVNYLLVHEKDAVVLKHLADRKSVV